MKDVKELNTNIIGALEYIRRIKQERLQALYLEANETYKNEYNGVSESHDNHRINFTDDIEKLRDNLDKLRIELLSSGIAIPEDVVDKNYEYIPHELLHSVGSSSSGIRTETILKECNYVFDHIDGDDEIWKCTDCGHEKKVPIQKSIFEREHVKHPYTDGPAKLNDGEYFSVTRTYDGPNGATYSVKIDTDDTNENIGYESEDSQVKLR